DVPEVALPVDEWVAHRERLREPYQRVVDRDVAVRVVRPHHVADDPRALETRPVRLQAGLVHRVEDAAMHRLQPVTNVRQRSRDDDTHRVVEEARAHLLLELARLYAAWAQRLNVRQLVPFLPFRSEAFRQISSAENAQHFSRFRHRGSARPSRWTR